MIHFDRHSTCSMLAEKTRVERECEASQWKEKKKIGHCLSTWTARGWMPWDRPPRAMHTATCQHITWMSASGFSRLRISASSCCLSSSTMEAKVTGEEGGGLPTAPSTQGLRRGAGEEGGRKVMTDRQTEGVSFGAAQKSASAWIKVESATTERLLVGDGAAVQLNLTILLLGSNKRMGKIMQLTPSAWCQIRGTVNDAGWHYQQDDNVLISPHPNVTVLALLQHLEKEQKIAAKDGMTERKTLVTMTSQGWKYYCVLLQMLCGKPLNNERPPSHLKPIGLLKPGTALSWVAPLQNTATVQQTILWKCVLHISHI